MNSCIDLELFSIVFTQSMRFEVKLFQKFFLLIGPLHCILTTFYFLINLRMAWCFSGFDFRFGLYIKNQEQISKPEKM